MVIVAVWGCTTAVRVYVRWEREGDIGWWGLGGGSLESRVGCDGLRSCWRGEEVDTSDEIGRERKGSGLEGSV